MERKEKRKYNEPEDKWKGVNDRGVTDKAN